MERRAVSEPALRVALVGYGLAGSLFHGPLLAATPGLRVQSVVTSDPARRARASADFPAAAVLSHPDEVWDSADRHDLVVVATGTGTHVEVATAAVGAGLAAVVEKPLGPRLEPARALVARAAAAGTMLTVFHNRRFDAEFLTLRRLAEEGALGEVTRFESRFERWRPEAPGDVWRHRLASEEGGGVLLDLGVHLVDQALVLLGPATHVHAEIDARRGGADDDVFVALRHASGARSHLWASAVAAAPGPRYRVLGRSAGFVVEHLDGQEDQLRAGLRPDDPAFGVVPEERWGRLRRGDEDRPVPSERGRWAAFYRGVVLALTGGAPPPVDPVDALAGLEVVEAARVSARERTEVVLPLAGAR